MADNDQNKLDGKIELAGDQNTIPTVSEEELNAPDSGSVEPPELLSSRPQGRDLAAELGATPSRPRTSTSRTLTSPFKGDEHTKAFGSEQVGFATSLSDQLSTLPGTYSQEAVEDRLYMRQGTGEALWNTTKNFIGDVTMIGLQSTVGLASGIYSSLSGGDFIDNQFNRAMLEMQQNMYERNPIFKSQEIKRLPWYKYIFKGRTLMDEVAKGFAMVGGIALSELMYSALATATFGAGSPLLMGATAKNMEKVGKAIKGLTKREELITNLSDAYKQIRRANKLAYKEQGTTAIRQLATGTFFEASLESLSFKQEALRNINKIDVKDRGAYLEDVDNFSNGVFLANMALTGMGNAILLPKMFAPLRKVFGGNKTPTVRAQTKLDYVAAALKAPISEGFVEEGGQRIVGNAPLEYLLRKYDPAGKERAASLIESFSNAFLDTYTTNEGMKEVAIGAFIGAFGIPGLGGSYMDIKAAREENAEFNRLSKLIEENTPNLHEHINAAVRATSMEAVESQGVTDMETSQHDMLFNYAIARIKTGTQEAIREDILESLNNMTDEQFKETFPHIDPKIKKEEVLGEYLALFNSIEQTYNELSNVKNEDLRELYTYTISSITQMDKRIDENIKETGLPEGLTAEQMDSLIEMTDEQLEAFNEKTGFSINRRQIDHVLNNLGAREAFAVARNQQRRRERFLNFYNKLEKGVNEDDFAKMMEEVKEKMNMEYTPSSEEKGASGKDTPSKGKKTDTKPAGDRAKKTEAGGPKSKSAAKGEKPSSVDTTKKSEVQELTDELYDVPLTKENLDEQLDKAKGYMEHAFNMDGSEMTPEELDAFRTEAVGLQIRLDKEGPTQAVRDAIADFQQRVDLAAHSGKGDKPSAPVLSSILEMPIGQAITTLDAWLTNAISIATDPDLRRTLELIYDEWKNKSKTLKETIEELKQYVDENTGEAIPVTERNNDHDPIGSSAGQSSSNPTNVPTYGTEATDEMLEAIADIEKRRQEEIGKKESRSFTDDDGVTWTVTIHETKDEKVVRVSSEKDGEKGGQYVDRYKTSVSNEKIYEVQNSDGYDYTPVEQVEVKGKRTDKINAKYDAELRALGIEPDDNLFDDTSDDDQGSVFESLDVSDVVVHAENDEVPDDPKEALAQYMSTRPFFIDTNQTGDGRTIRSFFRKHGSKPHERRGMRFFVPTGESQNFTPDIFDFEAMKDGLRAELEGDNIVLYNSKGLKVGHLMTREEALRRRRSAPPSIPGMRTDHYANYTALINLYDSFKEEGGSRIIDVAGRPEDAATAWNPNMRSHAPIPHESGKRGLLKDRFPHGVQLTVVKEHQLDYQGADKQFNASPDGPAYAGHESSKFIVGSVAMVLNTVDGRKVLEHVHSAPIREEDANTVIEVMNRLVNEEYPSPQKGIADIQKLYNLFTDMSVEDIMKNYINNDDSPLKAALKFHIKSDSSYAIQIITADGVAEVNESNFDVSRDTLRDVLLSQKYNVQSNRSDSMTVPYMNNGQLDYKNVHPNDYYQDKLETTATSQQIELGDGTPVTLETGFPVVRLDFRTARNAATPNLYPKATFNPDTGNAKTEQVSKKEASPKSAKTNLDDIRKGKVNPFIKKKTNDGGPRGHAYGKIIAVEDLSDLDQVSSAILKEVTDMGALIVMSEIAEIGIDNMNVKKLQQLIDLTFSYINDAVSESSMDETKSSQLLAIHRNKEEVSRMIYLKIDAAINTNFAATARVIPRDIDVRSEDFNPSDYPTIAQIPDVTAENRIFLEETEYTQKPFDKVSPKIKAWLALIPLYDSNGRALTSDLVVDKFEKRAINDMETFVNKVVATLSDGEPTWDSITTRIAQVPQLKGLYEALLDKDNVDPQFKKEFISKMTMQNLNMMYVKNDNPVETTRSSRARDARDRMLQRMLHNNGKTEPWLRYDENNRIVVNRTLSLQEDKFPKYTTLKELLMDIGFDISDQTLEEIQRPGGGMFNQLGERKKGVYTDDDLRSNSIVKAIAEVFSHEGKPVDEGYLSFPILYDLSFAEVDFDPNANVMSVWRNDKTLTTVSRYRKVFLRLRQLASGKLNKRLRTNPFSRNNYLKAEGLLDQIKMGMIDIGAAFETKDGQRLSIDKLTDEQQRIFRLFLFTGNKFVEKKGLRPNSAYTRVNIPYGTNSDKKGVPVLTTYVPKAFTDKKLTSAQAIQEAAIQMYDGIVAAELARMNEGTGRGVRRNKFLIYSFPALNKLLVKDENNKYILSDKGDALSMIRKALYNDVKKTKSQIQKLREDRDQHNKKSMLYRNHPYTQLETKALKLFNNLPEGVPASATNLDTYVERYITAYTTSHAMTQGSNWQLFASDPANAYSYTPEVDGRNKKDDERAVLRSPADNMDIVYSMIRQTMDNRQKRMAYDNAPGTLYDWSDRDPNIKLTFFDDNKAASVMLSMYDKLGLKKSYDSVESTDAGVLANPIFFLDFLVAEGSLAKQDRDKMVEKLKKGEDLTPQELVQVFRPVKPIYNHEYVSGNEELRMYIKMGMFPAFPQLFDINTPMGKTVHSMTVDGDVKADLLIFSSASKANSNKQRYKIGDDIGNDAMLLPVEGFKEQTSSGKDHDKINMASQKRKLITAMLDMYPNSTFTYQGETITGRDLKKKYINAHRKMYDSRIKSYYEHLGVKIGKDGRPFFSESKQLRKNLVKFLENYGKDPNVLAAIRDTKTPFYLLPDRQVIMNYITSTINNHVIALKAPGDHLVNIPEDSIPWKAVTWLDGKERTQLMPSVKDAEGENYMEIIVPRHFLAEYKKNGKFSDKQLKLLGLRVPYQGYGSVRAMKVVGVFDEGIKGIIGMSKDVINQMGSDNDWDKTFLYGYGETGDTQLSDEIHSLDLAIMTQAKDAKTKDMIQKLTYSPTAYGNIENKAAENRIRFDETRRRKLGEEFEYDNFLSSEYIIDKYQNARVAKDAVGAFANANWMITIMPKMSLSPMKINNQPSYSIETLESQPDTLDKSKTRMQVISDFLSVAVDAENLALFHLIGISPSTLNMVIPLAMRGYTDSDIIDFLVSPAFVEFVKRTDGLRPNRVAEYIIKDKNKQPSESPNITVGTAESDLTPELMHIFALEFQNALKINEWTQAVNTDSKQFSNDVYEIHQKSLDIKAIIQHDEAKHMLLEHVKELPEDHIGRAIPDTDRGGYWIAKNINGIASIDIMGVMDLYYNEFNFKLMDMLSAGMRNIKNDPLNMKNLPIDDIRKFVYTMPVFSTDMPSERIKLLFSDWVDDIAYMKEQLPDNIFLRDLQYSKGDRRYDRTHRIQMLPPNQMDISVDDYHAAFIEMAKHNPLVARNLVVISYALGEEFGQRSIRKFIPPSYLLATEFYHGLEGAGRMIRKDMETNQVLVHRIIRQHYQHNHRKAPYIDADKIEKLEDPAVGADMYRIVADEYIDTHPEKQPDFFRDSTNNLYERVGSEGFTYRMIETISRDDNYTFYNANKDLATDQITADDITLYESDTTTDNLSESEKQKLDWMLLFNNIDVASRTVTMETFSTDHEALRLMAIAKVPQLAGFKFKLKMRKSGKVALHKSVTDQLATFADRTMSPIEFAKRNLEGDERKILDRVLKYYKDMNSDPIFTFDPGSEPAKATSLPGYKGIVINFSMPVDARTVLHELIHGVTADAIAMYKDNPKQAKKILGLDGMAAMERLEGMFELFKERNKDATDYDTLYAMQNLTEFIAMVGSNADVQQTLKSTLKDGLTLFFDRLKRVYESVLRGLGLRPETEKQDVKALYKSVMADFDLVMKRQTSHMRSKLQVTTEDIRNSNSSITNYFGLSSDKTSEKDTVLEYIDKLYAYLNKQDQISLSVLYGQVTKDTRSINERIAKIKAREFVDDAHSDITGQLRDFIARADKVLSSIPEDGVIAEEDVDYVKTLLTAVKQAADAQNNPYFENVSQELYNELSSLYLTASNYMASLAEQEQKLIQKYWDSNLGAGAKVMNHIEEDIGGVTNQISHLGRHGDKSLSAVNIAIQKMTQEANDAHVKVVQRIDDLHDKVKDRINNIISVDKNGKKTGKLIGIGNEEFNNLSSKKSKGYRLRKDKAKLRNMVDTLDPKVILYGSTTEKKKMREALEPIIGESEYNYLVQQIHEIHERNLIQIEEHKGTMSEADLKIWKQNNTIAEANDMFENRQGRYENFLVYNLMVPKTKYRSAQFSAMRRDPDLMEYYSYYTQMLRTLKFLIPGFMTPNSTKDIPYIKQQMMEAIRDSGLKGGIVANIFNEFGEATDQTENPFYENEVTGGRKTKVKVNRFAPEVEKELKIRLIQNDAAGIKKSRKQVRDEILEEMRKVQSFDLTKIMKLYAGAVYTYNHRARMKDITDIVSNDFRNKGFLNANALLDYTLGVSFNDTRYDKGKSIFTVRTLDQKQKVAKAKEAISQLDPETNKEEIEKLQAYIDDQKRHVTTKTVVDHTISYFQMLSLGYNMGAAFMNLVHGMIANFTTAADGRQYSFDSLMKAYRLSLHSMGKNLSFHTMETGTAKKIRALMDRFDLLKDASTEFYKSSNKSQYLNKLRWLSPLQLTKRTEYLNYGPVMIAKMLETKIETSKGTMNLWEAFDNDGNWREDLGVEPTEKLSNIKLLIDELNNRNHGNYDTNKPILAKKQAMKRLLLVFRTFLMEGYLVRFEKGKFDPALQMEVKGRWRTFGEYIAQNGAKGAKDIFVAITQNLMGKKANFEGLSEVDEANMRAVVVEAITVISLTMLYLGFQNIGGDDEDMATRPLMRRLANLRHDMVMYISPQFIDNTINNPVPSWSLFQRFGKLGADVYKYMNGDVESDVLGRDAWRLIPGNSLRRDFIDITGIGDGE